MKLPTLQLSLPDWLSESTRVEEAVFPAVEDRMRLVVHWARQNVQYGTGGPFGAGIFDAQTHRLLAAGVNRVVPCGCSVAHAEIMAIAMAQQKVGRFELGGSGMPSYELVTSTEPCAMCFGAILWSGVRQLVCGARGEDACRVGFDEGPKPADWVGELERRSIATRRDVCREEAAAVLTDYRAAGGVIYNGRTSADSISNSRCQTSP